MSETSFVGKTLTGFYQSSDIFFFNNGEYIGRGIVLALFQTDVQQFPFAHDIFILGEEKRQLGKLDAEGYIGTDDVLAYIIGIIFAHQSGWSVNSYNFRF